MVMMWIVAVIVILILMMGIFFVEVRAVCPNLPNHLRVSVVS